MICYTGVFSSLVVCGVLGYTQNASIHFPRLEPCLARVSKFLPHSSSYQSQSTHTFTLFRVIRYDSELQDMQDEKDHCILTYLAITVGQDRAPCGSPVMDLEHRAHSACLHVCVKATFTGRDATRGLYSLLCKIAVVYTFLNLSVAIRRRGS